MKQLDLIKELMESHVTSINQRMRSFEKNVEKGFDGVHERLDTLNGQTSKNTEMRNKLENLEAIRKIKTNTKMRERTTVIVAVLSTTLTALWTIILFFSKEIKQFLGRVF